MSAKIEDHSTAAVLTLNTSNAIMVTWNTRARNVAALLKIPLLFAPVVGRRRYGFRSSPHTLATWLRSSLPAEIKQS